MNIGYRIQKSKKKAELHITYSLILTIKLEKFAPYFLLSICMQKKRQSKVWNGLLIFMFIMTFYEYFLKDTFF